MINVKINSTEGRKYPAKCLTKNFVDGSSPIQVKRYVSLDLLGGQEEVYFILSGTGKMCLGGDEKKILTTGQVAYIPALSDGAYLQFI